MELRGLEWEVTVCSELGEPELQWVTVSLLVRRWAAWWRLPLNLRALWNLPLN